jgi:hypothetical protein
MNGMRSGGVARYTVCAHRPGQTRCPFTSTVLIAAVAVAGWWRFGRGSSFDDEPCSLDAQVHRFAFVNAECLGDLTRNSEGVLWAAIASLDDLNNDSGTCVSRIRLVSWLIVSTSIFSVCSVH